MSVEQKIIFVLIIVLVVFAILFVGIIFFMIQFRKTKVLHIEELLKTKLEIQDETLTYVGRELHDNLGQLLTVSKIHVNSLLKLYGQEKKIIALDNVLDKTVQELRMLSKSLNNSRVKDFGFHKELQQEVDRLERMNIMDVVLTIENESDDYPTEKAIILYRIIQEFLSNSIKYSQGNLVKVSLKYSDQFLKLRLSDNGRGFDMALTELGSGVTNIKNRAQMLNAKDISYTSTSYSGTQLSLTLPLR